MRGEKPKEKEVLREEEKTSFFMFTLIFAFALCSPPPQASRLAGACALSLFCDRIIEQQQQEQLFENSL